MLCRVHWRPTSITGPLNLLVLEFLHKFMRLEETQLRFGKKIHRF